MNLPEYIKTVELNITAFGGDGSVIYTSSVSSAMICCYNLMCMYMNLSKRKNPPVPITVTTKSTDSGDESYTCFKFPTSDINLNILNRVLHAGGVVGNVVEYGSTINLEIYTSKNRRGM